MGLMSYWNKLDRLFLQWDATIWSKLSKVLQNNEENQLDIEIQDGNIAV